MVDVLLQIFALAIMVGLVHDVINAFHYQGVGMVIVKQKLLSAFVMIICDGPELFVIDVSYLL